MKSLNIIKIAITGLLMLAALSCNKKEETKPANFDVKISIPEQIVVQNDGIVQFKVLFSKAPLMTDKILFSDSQSTEHECTILEVNEQTVKIKLFDDYFSDTYKVLVKRNMAVKTMGTTKLVIDDGVKPAEGMNVYGRVCCGNEPLEGVVVSDGFEVVTTDAKGVFQMKSAKKMGYVFISIPSGYEVGTNGVLPRHYSLLTESTSIAERADFNLFKVDQSNVTLLGLGDFHLAGGRNNDRQYFKEFCNEIQDYVNSHKDEKIYALTMGDMTWDYYWYDKNYQFPQYVQDVNANLEGITFFHCIGNHDHDMMKVGDFDTAVQYMQTVAPDYYSLNIGNCHIIVLDDILCTNNGNGKDYRTYENRVTNEQIEWLKKDLSYVDPSTPVIVTMHAPTWSIKSDNISPLFDNFWGYPTTYFITGHTHQVNHAQIAGCYYEHNIGSVCGDWWDSIKASNGKVHLSTDGAPGGYCIFKIKGNDISWRFKGTGMDENIQFRSYDRNNIHLTADKYMSGKTTAQISVFEAVAGEWKNENKENEVYINVWNYEDNWKIEVTEDGKSLPVNKVNSSKLRDPLHILAYMPSCNKTKEDSFTTKNCPHMWMVKASSPNSTLTIKVTDKFGTVYTEEMHRPKAFDVDTYAR